MLTYVKLYLMDKCQVLQNKFNPSIIKTNTFSSILNMSCQHIQLNNQSRWHAISSHSIKKLIKMECHVIRISQTYNQNVHAISSYSIKQLAFGTYITIANHNLTNQNTTFDIHVTFGN
jgi:hypothetical protein